MPTTDPGELTIIGDHAHSYYEVAFDVFNNDSEFDGPVFHCRVFQDGCYWYEAKGYGISKFMVGNVGEGVVREILRDAEALGFFSFGTVLTFPEAAFSPQVLSIRHNSSARSVTYSTIRDQDDALCAVGLGPVAGRNLIICHLLAERILDIASDTR